MSYTVLARRYRSQTFEDVVGQDAIAQTMKNAIKSEHVAHAYLFCGTRGVGKTTMARILAKSLNCLNSGGPTINPCLKCDSCINVNTGEDIDVIEIDGASNNGVENIRQLRENANYRPARARYKIYIIDEIHMLSAGAFNALLKILEEPPAHIKFIFATTEPNKVLPTIQSRCQRFDFQAISPKTIYNQLEAVLKLEKISFEKDFLSQLARLANGSMRDALSLLDQLISSAEQPLTTIMLEKLLGKADSELINALAGYIFSSRSAEVLRSIENLLNQGQTSIQIADSLIEVFRDLMVIKAAGGAEDDIILLSGSSRQKLSELAAGCDIPLLVYGITAMERLRWTLRNSETARALLEATLLRLTLSEHFLGLDSLTNQVREAKSSLPSGSADIKKKIITSSVNENTQAAVSVQTAPAEQDSLVSDAAGIDNLPRLWPQITERIKSENGQVGLFLSQAKSVVYRNNILVIHFSDDGQGRLAVDMCQKKNDILVSFLRKHVGVEVKVKYELSGNDTDKPAQPAAPSPGARLNRRQQDEVLSDPGVKLVLQGLSARPLQIERIEENEEEKTIHEDVE